MHNNIFRRLRLFCFLNARWVKDEPYSRYRDNLNLAWDYLNSISPVQGTTCICKNDFKEVEYDLDIIIPVYNAEKYIEDCLFSIFAQKTHFDFHITVIDDGSTDGSLMILKKFVGKRNFRLIQQTNKGQSCARNQGIIQSRGRFLLFVDDDDLMCPGAIEKIVSIAYKTGSDIVEGAYLRFSNSIIYNVRSRLRSIIKQSSRVSINGYAWGKVYKRSLFEHVKFPENFLFEDTVVWMILEASAKDVTISRYLSYKYRMHSASITHTYIKNPRAVESLYLTVQLLEDRKVLGIENDIKSYQRFLLQMVTDYLRVKELGVDVMQSVFTVECSLIEKFFGNFYTSVPMLKTIQNALRAKDYEAFRRCVIEYGLY